MQITATGTVPTVSPQKELANLSRLLLHLRKIIVYRKSKMKVALVQFYPLFKKPLENIKTVDALLEKNGICREGMVDLILLPEMSFTGYCFEDRNDIEPFVETTEQGVSVEWAKLTSKKLRCHICVGVPLKENGVYFNSLLMVSCGRVLQVYHKNFLYETDYRWAASGGEFKSTTVSYQEDGLYQFGSETKLGFGICMDINPKDFEPERYRRYEFASYHYANNSKLLIMSMNWLTHERQPVITDKNHYEHGAHTVKGQCTDDSDENECIIESLSYWVERLKPLWGKDVKVLISNRIGQEKETVFVGCSCILDMKKPLVLKCLGRTYEGLLLYDL